MNKNLFELLNAVKLVDVLVTTALFAVLIGILVTQRENIKDFLENWRKKRNFEESAMTMINNNTKKIEELETIMINARETSRDIRSKMYEDLNEVSCDVKEIIHTLNEMQLREEERRLKEEASKRADIKEKIEKIYRECNEAEKCTDMQFETLKDLIEDYERHKGENSFVHSVVQKEMYTWQIIKKIPDHD